MTDVFEEVEEGLRQDKASMLWSRFSPLVYLAGFLIIAAVGFNEYMKVRSANQAVQRMTVFEQAKASLDAGDYVQAEEGFSALAESGSAISSVAANYLARVRLEGGGDLAGAEAALSMRADGDGTPFERLALLKTAYAKADSMSLPELESLLAELTADEDGLGILARELIAAKLYDTGDLVRARQEFSYLLFAPNAPQGVQVRAQVALAAIPRNVTDADSAEARDVPESQPADIDLNEEESGE